MNFLYVLFSAVMFLDCVFLVFLVLLQLPKKEAGAGMAFGGAATDALFGAGSGNVLTKVTKYAAGTFFGLALIMAVMASSKSKSAGALLQEELTKKGGTTMSQPVTAPPPATTTPSNAAGTLLQLTNAAPSSPAAPSNPAPKSAPPDGAVK